MYDVIVIGARVAGSPAAMLLARKGYQVLLVDRASFPSDTLSTHQVQIRGGAALKRWGLLDKVLDSNCPAVNQASFGIGPLCIHGKYPALDGVGVVVSPRRTILDKILLDAAVSAGVELREDFLVDDLVFNGGRVIGIRGQPKHASAGTAEPILEKARLVVGADGKHSLVAQKVKAAEYDRKPVLTFAYYTYWENLSLQGGELYSLPQAAVGLWPTNAGRVVIYTGYPITEFQMVRADIEGQFWKTMQSIPGLAERLRAGRQAERFYGTADLPAFYRRPFGPGWALVGDAGMTLDPITGQGIGHAFLDAERLADAVDDIFSGRVSESAAMTQYEQTRNRDTRPIYEFTNQLASFLSPSIQQQTLFSALARKPEAAGRFFGALSGSFPLQKFFSPANLFQIMGVAGMSRIFFNKLAAARHSP